MSTYAFLDEICKISAAKSTFGTPQTRSGRRSMTVDTMLRKDNDGTLYKNKLAEAVGVEVVNGKKRVLGDSESKEQLSEVQGRLGELQENLSDIPTSIFDSFRGMYPSVYPDDEEKVASAWTRIAAGDYPEKRAYASASSTDEEETALSKEEKKELAQEILRKSDLRDTGARAAILGGGAIAGFGAFHAPTAGGMLLGYKKMYHGTGAKGAEQIKQQGLRPLNDVANVIHDSMGSTVLGTDTGQYAYTTPYKAVANVYSKLREDGTVLSGVIPYERFKNEWIKDPEGAVDSFDAPWVPKEFAPQYISTKGLSPDDLKRTPYDMLRNTIKNPSSLLSYAKQNPGRVAGGAALVAAVPAGGYLLYRGVKNLYNDRLDRLSASKDQAYLGASKEDKNTEYNIAYDRARQKRLAAAAIPKQASQKVGFLSDGGYLLDQVGRPKTRKLPVEAPEVALRVKEGMFPTTSTPMGSTGMQDQKKLVKSQGVANGGPKIPGVPNSSGSTAANFGTKLSEFMAKVAFSDSGFGPTGGVFRPQYASYQGSVPIPSPVMMDPRIKRAGGYSISKSAGIPLTPKGRLASSSREGKPKMTVGGPSISDVSKPIGFGRALPGAKKNTI